MLTKLEQGLGYTFRNKALLENALTHSSYANENRERHLPDNERLEFLGDSILGFVVAEYLYRNFPDKPEGELTRIRADLVCERNLAEAAATIELGSYLLLGHGEEQGGGRKRDSIVSDAMESVIAASFMDGGFAAAKEIIDRLILSNIPKGRPRNFDYKTAFQELVQRKKDQQIHYELTGESGPDHDKHFEVEVLLNGKAVGHGVGSSKKRAEQAAAEAAIEALFPGEICRFDERGPSGAFFVPVCLTGMLVGADAFIGPFPPQRKGLLYEEGAVCALRRLGEKSPPQRKSLPCVKGGVSEADGGIVAHLWPLSPQSGLAASQMPVGIPGRGPLMLARGALGRTLPAPQILTSHRGSGCNLQTFLIK